MRPLKWESKPAKPMTMKYELFVEGTDDQHVIWNLCTAWQMPETFRVSEKGGYDRVRAALPLALSTKRGPAHRVGMILDADRPIPTDPNRGLLGRWQSLRDQLTGLGYQVPEHPNPDGLICPHEAGERPTVGLWLWPDNQRDGILEDFLLDLIDPEDDLSRKAEQVLTELDAEKLARFAPQDYPKAHLHTWLAWQEKPGRPYGQALKAGYLTLRQATLKPLETWLHHLFNPFTPSNSPAV